MEYQTPNTLFPPIKVVKSKKSMTVPDMSYTPREIIQKFSRGERVPIGFEGLYDDENSSPFDDDPTRDPNFDIGDYVEEVHSLERRQSENERRLKEKKFSDSQRKASVEELNASDAMKRETTSGEAENSSTV